MGLSSFDKRLLEEGLDWFELPRLASLLELLGTSRWERVGALVTMLDNASHEEVDEALAVFDRALARMARQRDEREREERDRQRRRRRRST